MHAGAFRVLLLLRRQGRTARAVRLDFSVAIAGANFVDSAVSTVPAELITDVAQEISRHLRFVVDSYLSATFDNETLGPGELGSPELPIIFLSIRRVRLIRDASAGAGRVSKVELRPYSGDPFYNLGIPVVLYM